MRLAIIGSGYVGLVTGTCLAEVGHHVICVDNNPTKLEQLKKSQIPIYEPGLIEYFTDNFQSGRLTFTEDLELAVLNSDLIMLCLPTPQDEDGSADLTHVMEVANQIGVILLKSGGYKVIVNKSTVPVGTGDAVKQILVSKGLTEFDIVSNPEFLREGLAVEDFMNPDRIIVGLETPSVKKFIDELYNPFVEKGCPVVYMDLKSAELTKYAANSFLAAKITFMNDLSLYCEKVGADIDNIRTGIGLDPRIGNRFLFPGIGYGGSCFPKDVNALIRSTSDAGANMKILEAVNQVNQDQRQRFINRILKHFNNDLTGKKFAVWGLSFKPETDDMREAPSITVINYFTNLGVSISAYDPAAIENAQSIFGDTIQYCKDKYSTLANADALIIFTEWREFHHPDFVEMKSRLKTPLIFDGRNIFSLEKMEKEGFTYYSVGRRVLSIC
jgi:UDPglucose 6-dehydrogenase